MTLTHCPEEFVLVATGPRLVLVRPRRSDALRARLHARSLDRRLAAGAAAESDRLLAVRAGQLVGRPSRRLARQWGAIALAAPHCAELWRLVEQLGRGAASARTVATASTMLPSVIRAGGGRGGVDVAAAAARTALGAA
jgi:hypothetical protein